MKYLLIILSLFLFTSPLFGHETVVLYQYETSSGIKWKTFGNEKVQPKYEGEISNQKPNGIGILYNRLPGWFIKDGGISYSPYSLYIGEWKNGGIHCFGTLTHSDGTKKACEFRQGQDLNITSYNSN